jgi:hypothetical protein
VAIKAKAPLLEVMTHHPFKDENTLLLEEKDWLGVVIPEEKKKIIAHLYAGCLLSQGTFSKNEEAPIWIYIP